jgi:CheY-like chemotaxis protein
MAYRTQERAPLRLTALVWGSDGNGQMFMEQVQTLDISPMGARLKGLTRPVSTGAVLGIQNGDNQGRFEVVWVGERGTEREGQIGVRCIQIGRQTKKSILYLDDQEFELERRKPLLEAFGYTAHVAASVQEAFQLMNAIQFNAVIVDQPFPGANDVTLIEQVRKTQPDCKVVVITAFPSLVSERVVAMSDAFIHKGENQNKLIAAIEQLIGPGHTLKWPITRTGQRYKVVVPVSVRVLRKGVSETLIGTSTDLSEGGVGVQLLGGELIAGEIVTVEFNLPTALHPMKLYAMVRHRKIDNYGIQFVDITPENRQAIADLCDVLVPMDVPH